MNLFNSIRVAILITSLISTNSLAGESYTTNADSTQKSFLVEIIDTIEYDKCGYLNEKGDTIVPLEKYSICYTDTIFDVGFVLKAKAGFKALDNKGKELFNVYAFDNGPDYPSEDLFRFTRNGKIGYANTKGVIVIPALYECAEAFDQGYAKVSTTCTFEYEGEHRIPKSKNWIWIDKNNQPKSKK